MDYMTVREVSESLGVSEKVVRDRINLKMPDKIVNGIETRLDLSEVELIARAIFKEGSITLDAVLNSLTSGKGSLTSGKGNNLPSDPLDMIIAIATEMKNCKQRLDAIESNQQKLRKPALELPKPIDKDAEINGMIRAYATRNNLDVAQVRTILYNHYSGRTKTYPKHQANKKGLSTIQWIRNYGSIDILYDCAKDYLR